MGLLYNVLLVLVSVFHILLGLGYHFKVIDLMEKVTKEQNKETTKTNGSFFSLNKEAAKTNGSFFGSWN